MFPQEIIERLGSEVTVALFPASLVSWKLVYVGIRDIKDMSRFTTSLVVQKIPLPLEEQGGENSFIQLSESSLGEVHYTEQFGKASMENGENTGEDTIALESDYATSTIDGNDDTDEEYILVSPSRVITRRQSIPMQRGNGPKSPDESICEIVNPPPIPVTPLQITPSNLIAMEPADQPGAVDFSINETILETDPLTQLTSIADKQVTAKQEPAMDKRPIGEKDIGSEKLDVKIEAPEIDISDLSPDPTTGAVEMLPGQKMLEKTEGTLIHVAPGIWVPHTEGLKESFVAAWEFIRRDGMGLNDIGRRLEGWGKLVGGRN